MCEAPGRRGPPYHAARGRARQAGARAWGGLGLAQLSQKWLDVLEELLGPEPVEEMTASREPLHRDVGQLLQFPLRRIVDRLSEPRLDCAPTRSHPGVDARVRTRSHRDE